MYALGLLSIHFRQSPHPHVITITCITSIRILNHLGSGEFGVVTHGMLTTVDGEFEVAVKMLNNDATSKDKLRFLQEATIMCQFDHENVIKLYGVVPEDPVMIVLEYMSRGDLRNFLHTIQPS